MVTKNAIPLGLPTVYLACAHRAVKALVVLFLYFAKRTGDFIWCSNCVCECFAHFSLRGWKHWWGVILVTITFTINKTILRCLCVRKAFLLDVSFFFFFFLYCQIYKGPDWSFRYTGLQLNCEYRFRACAIRQCQETGGHQDLVGPYSTPVLFISQRTEPPASTSKDSVQTPRTQWSQSDQVCAAVILALFAVFSILIAVIIQYFVIKWRKEIYCRMLPITFYFLII